MPQKDIRFLIFSFVMDNAFQLQFSHFGLTGADELSAGTGSLQLIRRLKK